jgi:hypothetical protein
LPGAKEIETAIKLFEFHNKRDKSWIALPLTAQLNPED